MSENIIVDAIRNIKNYIGKEVEIKTADGVLHRGFVYVFDPLSNSVVLTNSECSEVNILLCHAIKAFNVVEGGGFIASLALKTAAMETPCDSSLENKQKLANWLRENGIDVLEDGASLRISDYVLIKPPYDLDHCYCDNTVILERLQQTIKRMPP